MPDVEKRWPCQTPHATAYACYSRPTTAHGAPLPHLASTQVAVEVTALVCAIKPLCAWHIETTATTCRERCGGQGYLSVNRFGSLLGFAHAGMTAEGDNRVLMQKVAKEVLGLMERPGHVRDRVAQVRKSGRVGAGRRLGGDGAWMGDCTAQMWRYEVPAPWLSWLPRIC
eukprot:281117-Chlamydomonas_euryale.AAC.1